MKELDELKESVESLEPYLHKHSSEKALLSDCLNGIVKVLEKLAAPLTEKPSV